MPSQLPFIDLIPAHERAAFAARVLAIAARLGLPPVWLMALMHTETAGTMRPNQYNLAGSGAVGLLQFTRQTAQWLGTSTAQLAAMGHTQQLHYVEAYLMRMQKTVGRPSDYASLYMMVFYPAASNKGSHWVFPDWVYPQNKGLDLDQNGQITKGEFAQWVYSKVPPGILNQVINPNSPDQQGGQPGGVPASKTRQIAKIITALVLLAVLAAAVAAIVKSARSRAK